MNKILAALISSLFAVGAFAASHVGAPAAVNGPVGNTPSPVSKPAMAAPGAAAPATATVNGPVANAPTTGAKPAAMAAPGGAPATSTVNGPVATPESKPMAKAGSKANMTKEERAAAKAARKEKAAMAKKEKAEAAAARKASAKPAGQ